MTLTSTETVARSRTTAAPARFYSYSAHIYASPSTSRTPDPSLPRHHTLAGISGSSFSPKAHSNLSTNTPTDTDGTGTGTHTPSTAPTTPSLDTESNAKGYYWTWRAADGTTGDFPATPANLRALQRNIASGGVSVTAQLAAGLHERVLGSLHESAYGHGGTGAKAGGGGYGGLNADRWIPLSSEEVWDEVLDAVSKWVDRREGHGARIGTLCESIRRHSQPQPLARARHHDRAAALRRELAEDMRREKELRERVMAWRLGVAERAGTRA